MLNAATVVDTVHLSLYILVITSAVLSKSQNVAIKSVYMVMYRMRLCERRTTIRPVVVSWLVAQMGYTFGELSKQIIQKKLLCLTFGLQILLPRLIDLQVSGHQEEKQTNSDETK